MSDASREILRAWLRRELALGSAYLDDQVAHLYSGALGRVVNPLVSLIYRFAQRGRILRGARRQMDLLIEMAEHWDGTNAAALVESRLGDLLRTEELYVRGNRGHPRFPEVEERLKAGLCLRLEPLARMLRAQGATYDDLARAAYPSRPEAWTVIEPQFRIFEELLALVEAEGVMDIPKVIRREVFHLIRSAYEWYKKRVEETLDQIYRPPALPAPPAAGTAPASP